MPEPIIVAIDGPAGAGKSTVARRVARALHLRLVDTGAIYRSVALLAHRRSVDPQDAEELASIARELDIDFRFEDDTNHVLLSGEDVSEEIRSPEVAMKASSVSRHPEVREALLGLQRKLAGQGGAVLEGRDIGTVVCPDAAVKVFLDASAEERARRRHDEMQSQGVGRSLKEVLAEVEQRDAQDRNRDVAPLVPAEDAVVLDSTKLTVDEVVQCIITRVDTL